MFYSREFFVGVASVVVVAALAVFNPGRHVDWEDTVGRDRRVAQAAADGLSYETVSDAWMQARLGATAALTSIAEGIDLRYLSTHQEGPAIILAFQSRSGRCIDLISRPARTTVETRRC